MNLKEFRAKYPHYDDLDDQTLADSLHKTHYADIPRRQFDVQIGVRPVSTVLHGRRPEPVEQPSARPIDDKPAALTAAEIARGPATPELDPVTRTRERMASVAPRAAAGRSMQRSQQEHMRKLEREGSWGEVLTDTSVQIGAKSRSARGTVEEMAGKSLRGGANLDIRRAELLPFVVEDAKRLGIEPKDHPLVKREAKALNTDPQVFAEPALNPYYLNTFVKRLDKYRERAETGGRMAARGGEIRQEAATVAGQYRPRVEEWTPKDIISSIGQSAPELLVAAAGGAAGGVPAGLAAMGATVFPQFYAEALNEGRDEDTAARYAALMTVAEVLPEAPLLSIISKAGGKKALSRAILQGVQSKLGTLGKATAAEGASEMLTEAFQMGIRLGMFDEQVSVKEAFNRLAKAGVIGSAMGASLGAVVAGGQTVGEQLKKLPQAEPEAAQEEALPSTKDIMLQAAMRPPRPKTKRYEETLKEADLSVEPAEPAEPEQAGEAEMLRALRARTGTPEQAARAVSLGYAALNENNEPIFLPRGRRRLAAIERAARTAQVLPSVQPVEGEEALPGVRGAGEAARAEVPGVPAQAPGVARGEVELPLEGEPDALPGLAPAARAEPEEGGGLPQEAPVQAGDALRGEVAGTPVEVAAEPTDAQKEAGNYKKGRVRFKGLDISIENLRGQTREGKDARGRRWSSQMRAHYGYVRGTESKDGDPVDVFLGEDTGSGMAYVIDQLTSDGKNFDEHKVMLGFDSKSSAESKYREHYPKNWKGMGAITAVPIDEFKEWLNKGDTTKPMQWGAGFEPPRRSMRKPQPEHDTILEYISKLRLGGKSAGANFDELVSEGLDPADLKTARGHGINRPFTRNGATLDQLAEALQEAGYPVSGPDGRYDKNVLLARISDELHGRPSTSSFAEGFDSRMAKLAEQYEAKLEQEARDRPDETTEQRIERLTAELNALENERDAREEQEARALAEAQPTGPSDEPMFHRKALNKESLGKFVEETIAKHKLSALQMHLTNAGDIELSAIEVPREQRKQGVGSAAMSDIVALADRAGKRILLMPAARDERSGTTSRGRLVGFYKRFGFVENKGRRKDFTTMHGMYRDPARPMLHRKKPPTDEQTGDLFASSEQEAKAVALRNQIKKLELERDRRRNEGQVSADIGKPGDLFSEGAQRQMDITDAAKPAPAKPAAEPIQNQIGDVTAPAGMGPHTHELMFGHTTSEDAGHRHKWKEDGAETTDDHGHTHGLTGERLASRDLLTDKTVALSEVDAIIERARAGTLSLEDYKAAWQATNKSLTPLKAELEKLTKDELLERMGSMAGYRYRGETKARVVAATLEGLLGDFGLARAVSFTMGRDMANAYSNAIGALVEKTTEADLAEFAAKVTKARAERSERIDQAKAALADPQTKEQFEFFIRVRGEKALTMEQRDRYDALQAEDSLQRLAHLKAVRERERATVKAAGRTVDSQVIETKHTKKGHDLFVVQLGERVEREVYEKLNTAAKQLGGYYSSYKGGGAIPGFTFTERDKAQTFADMASTGDTTAATEVAKERRDAFKDDRTQSSVERLNEMADRLEERGEESLGQERQANTVRRARMAGYAEAQARQNIALARTMRNIAKAIESGAAKFLADIRTRAQVEMLSNYLSRARHDEAIAKAKAQSKSDYVSEDERLEALAMEPNAATARFLEFPVFRAYRSDIAAFGRELSEVEGAKLVGERILKIANDMTEAYVKFVRDNLTAMALTTTDGRPAVFGTREEAELARRRSPGSQKLATVTTGRGKHYVVLSPAQAIERNAWKGPADERVTLPAEIGAEAVGKARDAKQRGRRLSMPWIFEAALEERTRLRSMGLETSPMLREAMREFIRIRGEAAQADPVQKMMRDLVGQTIGIDFFPTPPDVAASLVSQADIVEGQDVLEPSAGYGAIADSIKAAGVEPDVVELALRLRDILTAKGYELVASDFMGYRPEKRYDRIVMNPPFSNGMDIDHVRHAYELLKDGGRIVAIMGDGSFYQSDKKATEFRDWLDGLNGTSERLPPGTFLDKSLPVTTGVNARVVVIDKPTRADRVQEERSPYNQPTEPQQLPVSRERALFETRMARLIQETITLSDLMRAERDRPVTHAKLSDFDEARIARVPERSRQHERMKIMKQRGIEPSADEFAQQVEFEHLHGRLQHYRNRRDQLIAANASWIYLSRDPQGYIDRIYRRAEDTYGKLGQLLQFQLRVREEQMGLPFVRKSEIELTRDAEMIGAEVILHPVRAFKSNVKRIRSAEDAAQIVRDMVREPQEIFMLLVADRDGKPLAALEHTLGGLSEANAYPSILVGAVASIPKASQVYMVHNHPTGEPQQSTADNVIMQRLSELLEDSGLHFKGSIVVAGDKYSWAARAQFPGDATPEALLGPEAKEPTETLQVFRRRFSETPRPGTGPALTRSDEVVSYVTKVFTNPGLLLLNTRHRIVARVKVPIAEMAKLRTGDPLSGAARILAELHRFNVETVIITTGKDGSDQAFNAALNLMDLLSSSGVRVLDMMQAGKSTAGQPHKWSGVGPFKHAKTKPLGYEIERVVRRATEPARTRAAVSKVIHATMRGWSSRPNVVVVENFGLLPSDVRSRLRMSGGRPGEVDMFFDPPTATLYAISEDLDSDADITGLVMHEAVVHFGIRQFLPENQYNEIMDGVARDLESQVRQKAKDYFLDFNDLIDRRIAAEEVIAEMAETYLNRHTLPARMKRWLDRIIAAILEGLARLGIIDRRYDKRFIAGLLTDLHEFVQSGESKLTKKHGALRHQDAPVYYSELFRQVNDEKFPHYAPLGEMRKVVKALATNGKIRSEELEDSLLLETALNENVRWRDLYELMGPKALMRARPPKQIAERLAAIVLLEEAFVEHRARPETTAQDDRLEELRMIVHREIEGLFTWEPLSAKVEKIDKQLILDYLTTKGVEIDVVVPGDPELEQSFGDTFTETGSDIADEDFDAYREHARGSVTDDEVMQAARIELRGESVGDYAFRPAEVTGTFQEYRDGLVLVNDWDDVKPEVVDELARERHYADQHETILEREANNLYNTRIPREMKYGAVGMLETQHWTIVGSNDEGWMAMLNDVNVGNGPYYTESEATDAIKSAAAALERPLFEGGRYLKPGYTIDPIVDSANYFERIFQASRLPGEHNPTHSHWDEPQVVAHVRGAKLETPDGKNVLFADELQSDWVAAFEPTDGTERLMARLKGWDEAGRSTIESQISASATRALAGDEGVKRLHALITVAERWYQDFGRVVNPEGFEFSHRGDGQALYDSFIKFVGIVLRTDEQWTRHVLADPTDIPQSHFVSPLLSFAAMFSTESELDMPDFEFEYTEMRDAITRSRRQLLGKETTKPPVSKTWQLMILKWLIRRAVDTDASFVAIAPGSVHSMRYEAMAPLPDKLVVTELTPEDFADEWLNISRNDRDPDLLNALPKMSQVRGEPKLTAAELAKHLRAQMPNSRFVSVGSMQLGTDNLATAVSANFLTSLERLPGWIGQEAAALALQKLDAGRGKAEHEATISKHETFLAMPLTTTDFQDGRPTSDLSYHQREHYGHMVAYNQVLPAMFNRWLKKYGVKIRPVEIAWNPVMNPSGTPEAFGLRTSRMGVRKAPYVERHRGPGGEAIITTKNVASPAGFYSLGFEINDALRAQAKKGFPLYHRKSLLGIFRRRQAVRTGTFDMTEGSKSSRIWNALVFKIQDRLYDLFRLQEEAKRFNQMSALPDALDAYLKETLFHGRVEDRVEEYEKNYVVPLVDKIRASGYGWPDVEDYLYARHAPEANLRLASINPGQPHINSGMTDVEAAQVQQDLAQRGDIGKLQNIGQHVDTMTKWYRQMIVAEGLEDPAVIQEWEGTYDFYVPLKGWAHNPELGELPSRGRGFDTGGKMHKERLGRSSRAANILANIVAQAQMGIIRAEKARVGRALLEFVKANPAPRLYEANQVEYSRYLDRQSGLVQKAINPTFKLADNVIRVRVGGVDEHITFNPIDPQMVRLARTMKNLSASEMNAVLTFLHGINRYLSMVNTSLNIEFIISNAFRDLQTAMVNIEATDARKLRAKVLGNWRAAWNGIRRGELGKAGPWEAEWLRFKRAGGKVGWIQNYKSLTDLEDSLRQELNRQGVIGHLGRGLEYAKEWIERQNLAVENAIRLATFKAATDAGISEERAAQIAKNLTVNFNKRGDMGVVLNSIYLFFNAAAQGTAILVRTAKSPRARRIMYGIVALGIARDIINRMVGGEDEDGEDRWDKIEEYRKERNMIFMLPPEARFKLWSGDEMDHIMIPMPYGYNWFDYLGQKLGGAIDYYGIGNKRRFEPTKDALRLVSSFLGAFNPVGWESSWETTVAPTILDPAIQLSQNKKWDGRPIMPPQPQYDIPDPDSQRFFKTSSHEARALASWLNEVTGGTDVTPGGIDISPETIEHWKDFAFGGAGRFVSNTINTTHDIIVAPEDLEVFEVPMLRRLIGQTGERQLSERFFDRMNQVAYVNKERDTLREMRLSGDAVTRAEYLEREAFITRKYPVAAQLVNEAKRAEMQLRALRRQRRFLEEGRGSMLETKRAERVRALNDRIQAVMRRFNRDWNEAEDASRQDTDTRDLTSQIGPLTEGKHRSEQIRSLRAAGYNALADLVASVPRQMRPAVREVLEKEARS